MIIESSIDIVNEAYSEKKRISFRFPYMIDSEAIDLLPKRVIGLSSRRTIMRVGVYMRKRVP